MNAFMSSNKVRKRPLFHLDDGCFIALALNALAVLVMISAIIALSIQANADELDSQVDDVFIDIEGNSGDVLENDAAAIDTFSAIQNDILNNTSETIKESDGDPQFCTRSARLSYLACAYESADDFWGAQSDCTNVSDPIDHATCRDSAYDEFEEQTEECSSILDARTDFCEDFGESRYEVTLEAANFVNPSDIGSTVDPNPFFPLVQGYRWTYEGDGETIQVEVTDEVIEINGIPSVVVNDRVTEGGETIEDTNDYFAQDTDGNVWYMGEISFNYEDGRVADIEGSWNAGEDGAQVGILMPASPMVGTFLRQEYLQSEAEDVGEIIDTEASESVPAASCAGTCLVIRDYTPLEPDTNEHKYYAPGIGLILEIDLSEAEMEDEEEADEEEDNDEEDEEDDDEEDDEEDDDDDAVATRVELIEFFQP